MIDRNDERILDAGWRTWRLHVPVDEIGCVASILEAYDNEFLVRTEMAGVGLLRVWFPAGSTATLEAVLRELRTEFPIAVMETDEGMAALDEVYPDDSK